MAEAAVSTRRNFETPLAAALAVLATLVGLFVLAWAVLYVTKGRFLEKPFERIASRQVGRPVTVGGDFQLYLDPHIRFHAAQLEIKNPGWAKAGDFIDADLVDLRVDVLRLLFGHTLFRRVVLNGADFGLEWDAAGKRNTWTFGANKAAPFRIPEIRKAAITDTHLDFREPTRKLIVGIDFKPVRARDSRFQSAIGFSGSGSSMDKKFTVTGRLDSPNETVAGGGNDLAMRIKVGDSRIDVDGTLPGVTQLDGADLNIRARGANLRTPFQLLAIAVPETRTYDLRADLKPRGDQWRFTNLRGTFGDSDLAGSMTIEARQPRIYLTADLRSHTLDSLDAGPWIGFSAKRLDALGGKGAIVQDGGHPRVLPDAPLASEGLARLDADVAYRADRVVTGTVPLSNLKLSLGLDNRRLTLKPVSFDLAGGRLTANIDLNARKTPVVTDYDIELSPVRLAELMRGFNIEGTGTTGTMRGKLKLTGYGNSVRESLGSSSGRVAVVLPKGTLWVRNAELLELDVGDFVEAAISKDLKDPARIRCGLIAFTMKNGIGRTDPIFIDTQKNVIRGGGQINLKDESLNLAIEADAKNPSIFSGQSPIKVGGYFAAPTVDPISRKLIERIVGGGVLGVLLSPIAVLAAFIDLGDEADTNCAPILAAKTAPAVEAADKAAEKH